MGMLRVLGLLVVWTSFAEMSGHRFPRRQLRSLENMPVVVEEPDPEDDGPDVILDIDDVLNVNELPPDRPEIHDALRRYRVHTYARPWLDAVAACWRDGHHLATPGDAVDARALGRVLKTAVTYGNITNTLMKDAMHIGVHSLSEEGTWKALEGDNPRHTSWLGFNVNFFVQKKHEVRCAAIMASGRFLQQRCGEKLIYACDTQYKKQEEITKQEEQDDGYAALGSVSERRSYRLHRTPKPWTTVRETCLKEGATLAVPVPARGELSPVANAIFALPNLPSVVQRDGIFIGINDLAQEGQWKNELYTYMTFDGAWSSGDPPHNRSSNCGVLISSGHISDAPCSEPKAFLCEKTIELDDNPEYEIVDGFGPFAFHVRSRTWIDAVVKCHSENATLAVPESTEEALAMGKLQRKAIDKFGLTFDRNGFYVGVHDIDADRRWRTVDGKKVVKKEGIGWAKYQQSFSRVTCAYLNEGIYGNLQCDFAQMFICKMLQ